MDGVIAVIVVVGGLIVGASVTGNGKELCDQLRGTYTPQAQATGGDVCPGGHWLNLFKPAPKPVK